MDALFDGETFAFLGELSQGRDKAWFDAHRATYDDRLVAPLRQLVQAVGARLMALDPSFEVTPQFNKTLTRLNRDMRFAKGGSPYKDHMLALFYRQGRKKQDPQLFVGLQPGESWVGLYVGPHLLAADAPVQAVAKAAPERLLAAGRRAGIGDGAVLATCERYGEVKALLAGAAAADYLRGPHLCAMRRIPAETVAAAGRHFAADCARWLAEAHALWSLYADASTRTA